jgi:Mg/Co/Ni transporter MgtE
MNKTRAIRHLNRSRNIMKEAVSGVIIGLIIGILLASLIGILVVSADNIDYSCNEFVSWIVLKLSL